MDKAIIVLLEQRQGLGHHKCAATYIYKGRGLVRGRCAAAELLAQLGRQLGGHLHGLAHASGKKERQGRLFFRR